MKRIIAFCAVIAAVTAFAGVGVTRKQLDRTVSEINSNMSATVSAEIDRNIDGHIERIGREAAAAATNYLPSFVAGLGEFADVNRFTLTEFSTNSLTFNDSFISNGVFVSVERKAYFTAGWVTPTNKGFRVNSSSYPAIPAGTLFAIDETPVESGEHPTAIVNHTGLPENKGRHTWRKYRLYCADLFSQPLDLLWAETRWALGTVQTDRRIAEQGLYRTVLSVSASTAYRTDYEMNVVRSDIGTSPGWIKPPSGETHIITLSDQDGIFRMGVVDSLDNSHILGTFTLVPTCMTDAEAQAARQGTPELLSAGSRVLRFLKRLLVPDAVAARHHDIFTSQTGIPQFRITWTTADGEVLGESWIAISRQPRKTKVDDKGMEHDTDETYVPCPWYTRDDWRTVENWISFPAGYSIYYEDALGEFQTEKGTRYGISNRMMNNATFKSLFLGHREMLDSLYVYPRKVAKKDPCKEGRHSYVHCVCSVCGDEREHAYEFVGDCKRCLREESVFSVDENNEIVEDVNSSWACGHIPDGEENHGGWRGVGEQVDEAGNLRYCGCACGHYADNNEQYFPSPWYAGLRAGRGLVHLTLDHDFTDSAGDADWQPGDENGNDPENVHHATLHCRRDCGTTHAVVENHVFYNPDGSLHDCKVHGVGDDNYHIVMGTCVKCPQTTETADLHRRRMPNEGDGSTSCECIGGVKFDTEGCGEVHHHYVVTACGEVRCLYCLSYHEGSPRLAPSEHTGVQPVCNSGDEILLANAKFPGDGSEPDKGVVLRARAPSAEGHPCGCGLVLLKHNFVEDPDTGIYVCPDKRPAGFEEYWWASLGCGYAKSDPEEDDGEYDATVSVSETRGGGARAGRTYKISSFSWNPGKGEPAPSPSDIWGDDPNAPTSLPPLNGGSYVMGDLAPTIVDFTYLTPMSSEWTTKWTWGDGGWEKTGESFWQTLKWWLQNTPVIFR